MMNRLLLAALLLSASVLHAQEATQSASMTDADEVRIGRNLAEQFVKMEGIRPTPQTKKIEVYLQYVGDRVATNALRRLPYLFRFDPDPKFKSSFALPGGEIFVGGGILAYIDSEDQLAAVLGHEIEHIALNHCRDRLGKVLSDGHVSAQKKGQPKVADFFPGYGHDNELAADREGVKLAMVAGYSPDGAIRLLQTFVILGEQTPKTPPEARSMLEERIIQIQSLPREGKIPPFAERPLQLP